ncbi:MAG: nucleotide exchange factor GrpE [Candidatus Bathyarchaeia archaeon]
MAEKKDEEGKEIERKAKRPSRSYKREMEELKKALEEERRLSARYLERLRYLQADFENHLKRIENEARDRIRRSNEQLILRLLPVIDDLEKAVEHGMNSNSKDDLLEGVEMILRNMLAILRGEGLEEIKATGSVFDPSRHEAISQVSNPGLEDGVIVRELRKGYMLKGRLLRPSLVEVVKNER